MIESDSGLRSTNPIRFDPFPIPILPIVLVQVESLESKSRNRLRRKLLEFLPIRLREIDHCLLLLIPRGFQAIAKRCKNLRLIVPRIERLLVPSTEKKVEVAVESVRRSVLRMR